MVSPPPPPSDYDSAEYKYNIRIAYALTEVRKYLIPDSNDEIRQEQMREMEIYRQLSIQSN